MLAAPGSLWTYRKSRAAATDAVAVWLALNTLSEPAGSKATQPTRMLKTSAAKSPTEAPNTSGRCAAPRAMFPLTATHFRTAAEASMLLPGNKRNVIVGAI